jgi:hypothetical protein
MPQHVFKLNTSTSAILSENTSRSVVTIPANAVVTLVDGDPEGDGLVKVRYRDQVLSMFAVDLRTRSKRMWARSA